MLIPNNIITESLAPAVAVSGIAILVNGLYSRFSTVASRVRELNRELRALPPAPRIANIQRQIPLFLEQADMIRGAMFLLFGALGMMVFTAFAIALTKLNYVNWVMVPAWSFLGGLVLMFLAVVMEAYQTILNRRTLNLDVDHSLDRANESIRQSQANDGL